MFKILKRAPLALGFLTWRFVPGEDALVLVVKGTYRLAHGRRAEPAEELDPVLGDQYSGDDPLTAAVGYASDIVPFKPRADITLSGKVYTPDARPLPQCSASLAVGKASLSLLATGDRYWLDPAAGAASDPRPFTEMPLTYDRAFGGPGFGANPAGKGVIPEGAREAIDRPLPNIEDPRELVKRPQDRPAPAGFGPLSAHWAHRRSRWVEADPSWAEHWPYPPDGVDLGYFNAAQPALQVEGYLRGDEPIVVENMDPSRRRYESALPGVRPRCFAIDRHGEGERFREVGLRLDTVHLDMDAEKLSVVWRGSLPVAGEDFEEVTHVYLTAESLDEPRAPAEQHRRVFEVDRLESVTAPAAPPPLNDNDAPAPAPAAEEPPAPPATPIFPPELRAQLAAMGATEALLAALERGDMDAVTAMSHAQAGVGPEAVGARAAQSKEQLRAQLAAMGHDPALLDDKPPRPPRRKKKAPAAEEPPAPPGWSRARVEAALVADVPLAGEDLSGVDLSDMDLRGRDLSGAILKGASLANARLDGAVLSGANLTFALAERCSLRGARLDEADLTGAALPEAVFEGAEIGGALFDDANLAGAKLGWVKAEKAYLRRVDLTRADLEKADLRGAHLDGARLDGASLREADLTGASAEGARGDAVDLRGAKLVRLNASEGSHLPRARLSGAKAERSRWMGANLEGADLRGADLRGADLSRADLSDALLDGADASEADLTRARLRRASLAGANLAAARLGDADLRRAVLREAMLYQANLYRAQIEGADLTGAFTAGTLLDSPVRGWAR